jgi:nitroreductase
MSYFTDLLIKRRSVRKFTDEPLTPEETRLILQAALLSPTSKNNHSWEFVVVEDKQMLEKLSHCKPTSAAFIAQASIAVVIVGNPLVSDVWIEDGAIAGIAMQLQAEDLNIGSCWVQVRNRNYSETITSGEYINDLLNIPMPLEPLCIIAFGKKEKERHPHDVNNLLWEKVHIEVFQPKE